MQSTIQLNSVLLSPPSQQTGAISITGNVSAYAANVTEVISVTGAFSGPVTVTNLSAANGSFTSVSNTGTSNLQTVNVASGSFNLNNGVSENITGNLNFTSVSQRITGDFSNATISNRVAFQTSTVNGNSIVAVIPNGTSTTSGFQVNAKSDINNTALGNFDTDGSQVVINSTSRGTGTVLPLALQINGTTYLSIPTTGGVQINSGNLEVALGNITIDAATSQILPGATSLSLRNHANTADNLLITDAGIVTLRSKLIFPSTAAANNTIDGSAISGNFVLIPGTTGFIVNNNANNANNLVVADSGNTTIRGSLTMGTTLAFNSAGVLQVAAQTNITSVGTLGTTTFSGHILTTAANNIGSTTSGWGVLYLGNTGTINWNNGQATLSQSVNSLLIGNAGLQIGAPTGGDKGVGTINTSAGHYINGAAINQVGFSQVSNFASGSSSPVDTGITVTMTTRGGKVAIFFGGIVSASQANNFITMHLVFDGTDLTAPLMTLPTGTNGYVQSAFFTWEHAPSAASHTWKIQLQSGGSGNTADIGDGYTYGMTVVEYL